MEAVAVERGERHGVERSALVGVDARGVVVGVEIGCRGCRLELSQGLPRCRLAEHPARGALLVVVAGHVGLCLEQPSARLQLCEEPAAVGGIGCEGGVVGIVFLPDFESVAHLHGEVALPVGCRSHTFIAVRGGVGKVFRPRKACHVGVSGEREVAAGPVFGSEIESALVLHVSAVGEALRQQGGVSVAVEALSLR